MIVIVDLETGNLGSIRNMLRKIGVNSTISSRVEDIGEASKIILPGVGAFDSGISRLRKIGLEPVLRRKVLGQRTPLLAICLGMQLLTEKSEEGNSSGLAWIEAQTVRFAFRENNNRLKIPHMGWNSVRLLRKSKLFEGLEENARFYFAHSFHLAYCDNDDELTQTDYGYSFCSSIERDNILAVQFHPEKSHKFGMKLLKNFIEKY